MKRTTLNKLSKKLPRGWRANIAEKTGFSVNYISAVMNGRKNNSTVIETAIKLVEEENQRLQELEAKINRLPAVNNFEV